MGSLHMPGLPISCVFDAVHAGYLQVEIFNTAYIFYNIQYCIPCESQLTSSEPSSRSVIFVVKSVAKLEVVELDGNQTSKGRANLSTFSRLLQHGTSKKVHIFNIAGKTSTLDFNYSPNYLARIASNQLNFARQSKLRKVYITYQGQYRYEMCFFCYNTQNLKTESALNPLCFKLQDFDPFCVTTSMYQFVLEYP